MKSVKSVKSVNVESLEMNNIFKQLSPVKKIQIFKGNPGDVLFSMLYLLRRYKNRLCVPIPSGKKNLYNFNDITISYSCEDNNQFNLNFPNNFMETFDKCMEKFTQFIMLPIFIEFTTCNDDKGNNNGHLNFMIIDKKRKEVERFEPYGNDKFTDKPPNKFRHDLMNGFDDAMRDWVEDNLESYRYKTPEETCPDIKFGVQEEEERALHRGIKSPALDSDPGGFCSIWSIWYGELRLKYPNKSSEDLLKKAIALLKDDHHSVRTFIRNYSGFIYREKRRIVRKYIKTKKIDLKSSDLSIMNFSDKLDYIELISNLVLESQFKKKSLFSSGIKRKKTKKK